MQGKPSEATEIEFVAIPDTPAVVDSLIPALVSNFGGETIQLLISNMKAVKHISNLEIAVELDSELVFVNSSVQPGLLMISTIEQTLVAFEAPPFFGGGLAKVTVWNRAVAANLSAQSEIQYRDDNIAVFRYVYPSNAKAGELADLEVSIGRLGATALSSVFAWPSDNFTSVDLLQLSGSRTGDSTLLLRVKRRTEGYVNITVSNEMDPKKTISFSFFFRDPTKIWILFANATSSFTDGRVPIQLNAENVPLGLAPADVRISMRSNATTLSLEYKPTPFPAAPNVSDATIVFTVPTTDMAGSLFPVLNIPSRQIGLRFPEAFTYLQTPNPTIRSLTPVAVPYTVSSFVKIVLDQFPGTLAASDATVSFYWPQTKHSERAEVLSFSQADPAVHPAAVQSFVLNIKTPRGVQGGTDIVEGLTTISVYHNLFAFRQAKQSGFLFYDPARPQVSGMTADSTRTGSDSVLVQMFSSSSVAMNFVNAKEAITQVVVGREDGAAVLELASASFDAEEQTAGASFFTFPRSTAGDVLGLAKFGRQCGAQCSDAACCESFTCVSTCTCATACFTLTYFNELLPRVLVSSELEGPDVGATLLTLTIANFPVIASGAEVSAMFDGQYSGTVFLRYSSKEETAIEVETPFVPSTGLQAREVPVQLKAFSRPDRQLDLTYTVRKTSPKLKSAYPRESDFRGGTSITCTLDYFPFTDGSPDAVAIFFGDILLPDDNVTVSEFSTLQASTFSFVTPATEAGVFEVRVSPKTCSSCDVTFTVEQIGDGPRLAKPLPIGGSFNPAPSDRQVVRLSKWPADSSVTVSFVGVGLQRNESAVVNTTVDAESRIAAVAFAPPAASVAQTVTILLTFVTVADTYTVPFEFQLFDPKATRVSSKKPSTAPTRIRLYGSPFDLRIPTLATIENFPPGYLPADLEVIFGEASRADIISVSDAATCDGVPCNRTTLEILLPSVDFPGVWQASVAAGGQQLVAFEFTFFAPCQYDEFCMSVNKIAEVGIIVDSPPTSAACQLSVCSSPSLIPETTIASVFPSSGLASGGDIVTVNFDNLPALGPRDATIQVGTGPLALFVNVISLEQFPGSRVTDSSGSLSFRAPSAPSGVLTKEQVVDVQVTAAVAGVSRSAGFQFQYLPVLLGRSIFTTVYPSVMFADARTKVITTVTNFPALTDLTDVSQIRALLGSTEVVADSIVSSTTSETKVCFFLEPSVFGSLELHLYYAPFGVERAAIANITVLEPPVPIVQSVYPSSSIAGKDAAISATVWYLSPNLTLFDLEVGISFPSGENATLTPTTVSNLGASDCRRRECASTSVTFVVPAELAPANGGLASVIIRSSEGDEVSLQFVFRPDTEPSVESFLPPSLRVSEVDRVPIEMFVKNVPSTFCANLTLCSVSFGSARGAVNATTRLGTVTRIRVFAPPSGNAGQTSGSIQYLDTSVSFTYTLEMSDVVLEPIDALCDGGTTVMATWEGMGRNVTDISLISVNFGEEQGTVIAIAESIASASFSSTTISVVTPAFEQAGTMTGSLIVDGTVLAIPFFECFQQPTVQAAPASATVDGRTTSVDGQTTTLTVRNFPSLRSSQDVSVSFGDKVCDGVECAVISYSNSVDGVQLVTSVPAWDGVEIVTVRVRFTGKDAVPPGGDPAKEYVRSSKVGATQFSFYLAQPTVQSAAWCSECVGGSRCMFDGKCSNGEDPVMGVMAASGKGVLTLVVDDVPPLPFQVGTGILDEPASVSVEFGDAVGQLDFVVYSDSTRSSFQFALGGPVPIGDVIARLVVKEDSSVSFSYTALFSVNFFNDINVFLCLNSSCIGPSTGGVPVTLSIALFPVTQASELAISFGSTAVQAISLISSSAAETIVQIVAPSYICASCSYSNGAAVVPITIGYSSDNAAVSSVNFVYWAAPTVRSSRFDSTGTSISIMFDQVTDMAGMTVADPGCSNILSDESVVLLGAGATCVWPEGQHLLILLGAGATVIPGDALLAKTVLRSLNGVSPASSWNVAVGRPSIEVPPQVSIAGVTTIDPCSSLELFATVISPRENDVTYSWYSDSDENLNTFLSATGSSYVYLPEGTSVLTALDKVYSFSLVVTDFLGVSSSPAVFRVLKKSTSIPQVQFNPPSASTTRNREVLLKGEAKFSGCPTEQTELQFSWRQVSGPALPETVTSATLSHLYIPPNTLVAGQVYQLALRAEVSSDPSLSDESVFLLQVGYQPLQAVIAGGSSRTVSSASELVLSAAGSFDPDGDAASSSFAWRCSVSDGTLSHSCRNASGHALSLPASALLRLPAGSLAPSAFPYEFAVTVSKPDRSPATALLPVRVVTGFVPSVQIVKLQGGTLRADGSLYVKSEERLVFEGLTDVANASFAWGISPYINATTHPYRAPLGFASAAFVFQGSLSAGNRYVLSLMAHVNGSTGDSGMLIAVNSPPIGGSFSACLLLPGQAGCAKDGQPLDIFRLQCSGWSDADLPLQYQFGYTLDTPGAAIAGNLSNSSISNSSTGSGSVAVNGTNRTFVWFDPVFDPIRDMSFPSGNIQLMARVHDSYGATTALLQDDISVGAGAVLGRRLLNTAGFWAKASSMVGDALKTHRADRVNQLAATSALEADAAPGASARALKASLLSSLESGSGKAVKTNGFACEAYGSAALVTNRAEDLDGASVASSAGLLKSMVAQKAGGSIDGTCADNAAGTLGSSLKAMALLGKNRQRPALSTVAAADFMSTLESGTQEVMRQAAWDAVQGEGSVVSSTDASEHAVTRTMLRSVAGAQLSHPMPAFFSAGSAAQITIPPSFADDVFGSDAEVDLHLQSHGFAPGGSANLAMRSPLVGVTVSRAQAASEIPVGNLSQPVIVKIPVDTSSMTLQQMMIFKQQARCVFWSESSYSWEGCNVTDVSLNEATCVCSHLTMFAISQDADIEACGDGRISASEECDDGDIFSSDGCSSSCTVEATYSCEGVPSLCTSSAASGQDALSSDGVRASISISGYLSKEDFLNTALESFISTMAAAVGLNVTASEVIVIEVCFGSDCTRFVSGRRSAGETVIDFQVNVATAAVAEELLAVMRGGAFADAFGALLSAATGRNISASFASAPIVIVAPQSADGWDPDGGAGDPGFESEEEETLVEPGAEGSGLSVATILVAMGGTLGAGVLLLCLSFCLKRLWQARAARARKKVVPDPAESLALQRPHSTSGWMAVSPPQDTPGAPGGAPAQVETTPIRRFSIPAQPPQPRPPSSSDSLSPAAPSESTPVHPFAEDAAPVAGAGALSAEGDAGALADGGAGSEAAAGGGRQRRPSRQSRFQHARQRLMALQNQLDSILSALPEQESAQPDLVLPSIKASDAPADSADPLPAPSANDPDLSPPPAAPGLAPAPAEELLAAPAVGGGEEALREPDSPTRRSPVLHSSASPAPRPPATIHVDPVAFEPDPSLADPAAGPAPSPGDGVGAGVAVAPPPEGAPSRPPVTITAEAPPPDAADAAAGVAPPPAPSEARGGPRRKRPTLRALPARAGGPSAGTPPAAAPESTLPGGRGEGAGGGGQGEPEEEESDVQTVGTRTPEVESRPDSAAGAGQADGGGGGGAGAGERAGGSLPPRAAAVEGSAPAGQEEDEEPTRRDPLLDA